MNKKAQEISTGGFLMGLVGAVVGWIMAARMGSGILLKLFATVVTGFASYFVASKILNS